MENRTPPESFLAKQQAMLEKRINALVSRLETDNPEDEATWSKYQSTLTAYRNWVVFSQRQTKKSGEPPTQKNNVPIPQKWNEDIDLFAREALDISLFDHQQQLCRSPKRVVTLIAGRGAGKSVAARVKALHRAVCNPDHTVLVVSSGQRMSSDFGQKMLDLIQETAIREMAIATSQEQVSLQNGSVIKFLPANADTIRGYHPKTTGRKGGITVILDEACFMEHGNEIRVAVEYALITTDEQNGSLIIVSSPSSISSWVYEYIQSLEKEGNAAEIIQCPSAANPTISKEELERLKATKNELEYRAEVLGEWTDSAYSLFSGLIIDNTRQINRLALPKNTGYSIGVDLALSFSPTHDNNVVAVMAKSWPSDPEPADNPFYTLVEVIILTKATDRDVRDTIEMLLDKYPIENAAIEQFQGKALAEFCQELGLDTQLVNPTLANQQYAFHAMHGLLKEKKLTLAHDLPDAFFKEMKAFEYRREASGQIKFGHPASGKLHDDSVYAAVWALHAALQTTQSPPQCPPLLHFFDP
jgi:hypothetical protein